MIYPTLTMSELIHKAELDELSGFFNVCDEDYYAFHHALAQSYAKEYERSAAHYKTAISSARSIDPETQARFDEGNAWHCALLEPDEFDKRFCELPKFDRRTKKGKQAYEEWRATTKDRKALPQGLIDKIYKGVDELRRRPEIWQYIERGVKELAVFARDPVYQILLKGKLDNWIAEDSIIFDVKTTANASKHAFSRSILNYGYLVQAAWYCDLVYWATGIVVKKYGILALEKNPPFGAKIYFLSDDSIDLGRRKMARYLNMHYECSQTRVWSNYTQQIEEWTAPSWAFYDEEQKDQF